MRRGKKVWWNGRLRIMRKRHVLRGTLADLCSGLPVEGSDTSSHPPVHLLCSVFSVDLENQVDP